MCNVMDYITNYNFFMQFEIRVQFVSNLPITVFTVLLYVYYDVLA